MNLNKLLATKLSQSTQFRERGLSTNDTDRCYFSHRVHIPQTPTAYSVENTPRIKPKMTGELVLVDDSVDESVR